jgi:hypothetical protein
MSDPGKTESRHTPPTWGGPLTESDYLTLERSWIARKTADDAMLRRVDAVEGRQLVGQGRDRDCAGIYYPYYWPGEASPFTYRVRRDSPDVRQGSDGKIKLERKYLAPLRDGNHLYIPPGVTVEQLHALTIPIVLVEGEKKALALWRLASHETPPFHFIVVAIPGVWSWLGRTGTTSGPRGEKWDVRGPIADLSRIPFTGRRIFILFDSNVHSNERVKSARTMLAQELTGRGAMVNFITLPKDCGVNGVDDLLALWGPERVLQLFEHPEPAHTQHREPSQAELLTHLGEEAELFHTPAGEAYGCIGVGTHHETRSLRGKDFRRWLSRRFYDVRGKPPGAQALHDALGILEAQALYDGLEVPVFVRTAEWKDRIYIDMCNPEWQAVEITAQGWEIVSDPPVRFRRAKGMLALPRPERGGSLSRLRSIINVGEEENWILCESWLVAALRPRGPYPILVLQGEQGSAKSTTEKILRRLIDPSTALVRRPPREDRDLVIAATNSWVIAYDNLSFIPPWLSDSLCRMSTGGGFSIRELYTDSDEVFFDVMRPVVLNGIDHLTERADLADRALILHLPQIDDLERRSEKDVYADFERDLPRILGALCSALSAALERLPHTRLEGLPRMADFALWATAAEPALGFSPGTFMCAYQGNRAEAIQETIEADAVGAAILTFMEWLEVKGETRWTGTCKELLAHLEESVEARVKKSNKWPRNPRALSAQLRRLVTFLSESGVAIVFPPKGTRATHGRRLFTITRINRQSTATTDTTATA